MFFIKIKGRILTYYELLVITPDFENHIIYINKKKKE